MKKLLVILVLGILFCNTCFALSPEREKVEYDVCYDGMISQGVSKARSREYCVCSVTMISNKYSDSQMNKIVNKGWDYMMKKIKFAGEYCKKNRYAK